MNCGVVKGSGNLTPLLAKLESLFTLWLVCMILSRKPSSLFESDTECLVGVKSIDKPIKFVFYYFIMFYFYSSPEMVTKFSPFLLSRISIGLLDCSLELESTS